MCGIFGVWYGDADHVPSTADLSESARLLQHRGPDSGGTHVAPGVGFAFRRLTFLDTAQRANQPLWDPTGRYCIVFNGEIYNFRELRQELEAEGACFRTTSDTEVVLQSLIRREPLAAIRRLSGMFAFGFYDSVDR